MKIENKIIDEFHSSQLKNHSSCIIKNSLFGKINFDLFEPTFEIVIENCIIGEFLVHSCWFKKGLIFNGNHITKYIDYQMGGHNEEPIKINENIFDGFVNFFDCHFHNQIIVQNNIFKEESNLLGNLDEGFKNLFDNGNLIMNNIGNINIDGFGE